MILTATVNDSYEALILLTDPTEVDTDGDGIPDGIEVNGLYGFPEQPSDPRDNKDDDHLDDGEEDINGNVLDEGETDPTRIEDEGDIDNDDYKIGKKTLLVPFECLRFGRWRNK